MFQGIIVTWTRCFECGEGSVCCSVRSEGVTRFKYNQEKADDDYNDIGGLVTDEMKHKELHYV